MLASLRYLRSLMQWIAPTKKDADAKCQAT